MKYEAPEMEILYLEAEDVITLSDGVTTGDDITKSDETTDIKGSGTGW